MTAQMKAASEYPEWDSVMQPFPGLEVSDYITLARDAAPSLAQSAREFCERNKFSYVEIPHEVFKATYEQQSEPISFREWVEEYCKLKGLPSVPQMAIIGPRVKTLESAERKTGTSDTASHNPDYLGIMFVVLKGSGDRTGLNRLETAMRAMEHDQKNLAVKNYYKKPHKGTGFRAFKAIWPEVGAPGTRFENFGVLSEIKLQHEDHMDIDNLTRNRIVTLNRQYQRWLFNMHSSFSPKQAAVHSGYTEESRKFIANVGIALYNLTFEKSGLNRFLAPELRAQYAPREPEEIKRMILVEGLKYYQPRHLQSLLAAIEDSGVFPARSTALAKSPHRHSALQREMELSLSV